MNSEKIFMKFKVARTQPFDIKSASITSPDLQWTWKTNIQSFEVIHGLSRIIRLIPDKLHTALVINKENFQNPEDDGTFLIKLVTNLLEYYIDRQTTNAQLSPDLIETDTKIFGIMVRNKNIYQRPDGTTTHITLIETMRIIYKALETLANTLKAKNYSLYLQQTRAVYKILDLTNIYTKCYLSFIHPVWIRVKHARSFRGFHIQDFLNKIQKLIDDTSSLTPEISYNNPLKEDLDILELIGEFNSINF